jgi:integrase
VVQGPPQPAAADHRRRPRSPGHLRHRIHGNVRPSRRTFFVSSTGNPVTPATVGVIFNRIWDAAGLARHAGGKRPRPYDFRHHFAYANLERWMAQGMDVAAMLPYLSTYMGHATVESTYYYIHTSPGFMQAYAHITAQGCSPLPEAGFE